MTDPGRSLDLDALRAKLAGDGARLWRSLDELAGEPEVERFLAAEFPAAMGAGVVDRRMLLRLLGASLALGGLAACDRNQVVTDAPLLSQARNTPGHTPGRPVVLATTLELNGYGRGALVRTHEGRPVKIEGNPLHPASLGRTDVFMQAEVLSLYDPGRSATPVEAGEARSWEAFQAFIRPLRNELVVSEGRGLHVLMEPHASPTLERLVGVARQLFPHARWHHWGPVTEDGRRAGARLAFGRPLDCVYDLTQVDAVLTLGGDLFLVEPGHIRYAADWQARRRAPDRPLPRLIAAESAPSLVGARADDRVRLRPRDMEGFARAVAAALDGAPAADAHPAAARVAALLQAAGARALVAPGPEQSPVVHALAHAMNARLNAFGTTVRAIEPVRAGEAGEVESLIDLAQAIAGGGATRLLVLGGNPAYDAPVDLDFANLIARVPLSVHVGYHRNETAALCRWHVPQCHALEAFGDLRAFEGTVGLRQPATLRLLPSLSLEETLGLMAGQNAEGPAPVQATWREALGEDFDARWARALEDGVMPGTAAAPVAVTIQPGWDRGPSQSTQDGIDVAFAPDPAVWDGRFADNAWLLETPKPLTKQVWGNAALIAPETAERLGLQTGDKVTVSLNERALVAPVWVLPGHAPDTVTLPLGYGHTADAWLGQGIGFDAYRLRPTGALWHGVGALARAEGRDGLISTQHHHALPEHRDIVRVVAEPDAPALPVNGEEQPTLYPPWSYDGHAWAMAIDLDACIGCNACVVACQAENNVAVVGPEQVAMGREMHWLRIDRYYAGEPAAPKTYFQPVPCMHCEHAPCEVVCPVNATVHSSEGLNDMVYNRCIGTRTCSNNCPYKVRRFNFLDYQAAEFAVPDEVSNPQVTVRQRGVMEKCTYCVQRIRAARIEADLENRPLADGEVVTACQQACPTTAIVFGDGNDPDAAVSRLKRSGRNYALLGDLNTRPRTTYLARIEPGAAGEGG